MTLTRVIHVIGQLVGRKGRAKWVELITSELKVISAMLSDTTGYIDRQFCC
jgi:hypothetical protein